MAAADIYHCAAADFIGFRGQNIRPHHITHMGEIARLFAVAGNRHRLIILPLLDKFSNHQSISAVRIIARP